MIGRDGAYGSAVTAPVVVGLVLVRDENVFVERTVRNVAGFCDRLFLADHSSRDGTAEILARLADELPHASFHSVPHPGTPHRLVEGYAGERAWVFGVDGDEIYDSLGLAGFRERLVGGEFDDWFSLRSAQLHCRRLDVSSGRARGWLAPPARTTTKLYNFGALEAWDGPVPDRLHGGRVVFRDDPPRDGRLVVDEGSWETSPFRRLHTCFLRRSTRQPRREVARHDYGERGEGGRRVQVVKRARRLVRRPERSRRKLTRYTRGEEVEVDVAAFFADADADRLAPSLVNLWT